MGDERRIDPRFRYTMKAYTADGEARAFETTDVSASGAYFSGDPSVADGAGLALRLELATTDSQGRPTLYPLDAEVVIARTSPASDGTVQGFGARWVAVSCEGDLQPLRQFLKAILSISAGFVQTIPPVAGDDEGAPLYRFVFPGPAAPRPEPQKAPPAPSPRAERATETRLLSDLQVQQETRTGVYLLLPVMVAYDGEEYEAKVVKMLPHNLRLSSGHSLPAPYHRLTIKIAVKHRDKPGSLDLQGTVTAVRPGQGDNQFEVELSLGNEPEALAQYRKILDGIVATLRK
jgi:hypothetical protein